MNEYHIPVLLQESIDFLISNKSGIYFDGTIGFGGHTEKFLNKIDESGGIIASEVDINAYEYCKKKFHGEERLKLHNANFSQIDSISKIEFVSEYDGIFADLGVSSYQLDTPESGFTYRLEGPLDLRLDKTKMITAADIVNSFSEEDLADIFFSFGEEKNSRKIARLIVEKRALKKIKTSSDLVGIIEGITSKKFLNKTLSRVFQALRIYINDELGALKDFLSKGIELLKPGGNFVILTYHSLEDRIVKEFFKYESLSCICPPEFPICVCGKNQKLEILTKKPVLPAPSEIQMNKRARSAKLRAAKRL